MDMVRYTARFEPVASMDIEAVPRRVHAQVDLAHLRSWYRPE